MPNRDSKSSSDPQRTVQSIEVLFSILEFLKENDGGGVTEVAEAIGMSKGAIHRYLTTLVENGYARKIDGTYRLGLRFLDLGTYTRVHYDFEGLESKVEQVANQTKERAQFIVEEHGRGIYLHRERGENAVETDARVGKVVHLHTIAAGKAILAHIERERVEEIVNRHGLQARTPETITSRGELYNALEATRERGYAFNYDEHIEGLCGVGVPITDENKNVRGALSVSGPTIRVKNRIENGEIPEQILGSASEIQLNLQYS